MYIKKFIKYNLYILTLFVGILCFFTNVNAADPITCVYQKKEDASIVWTFKRDSSGNVSFIANDGDIAKVTSYLDSGIKGSCPAKIYYAHNGTCSTMMDRFIVDQPKDVMGAEDICSYFTYELISTEDINNDSNNNSNNDSNNYIQADGSLVCIYRNDSTEWVFTKTPSQSVTFKSNSGQHASGPEISSLRKNIVDDCPLNIYYTDQDCTTPKQSYGVEKPENIVGSDNVCSFTKFNLVPPEYVDYSQYSTKKDLYSGKYYCGIFGEGTWNFIQRVYTVIRILVPVLIIVLGIIDFLKVVFTGEDKDLKTSGKRFLKRIIAGIVFLLLPILLQFVMNLAGFSEDCLAQLTIITQNFIK